MLKRALRIMKQIYFNALLAPRGYGRPVPASTWDKQYQQGDWNYLYSVDELSHYMVTVGYVYAIQKAIDRLPTILDVGCGQGRLLELLAAFGFQHYHGIDLSAEAIKKAELLAIKNATFEVADFETWQSKTRFDIIVFNESLYYALRPVDVLLHYGRWLEENGSMIVSMYQYANHEIIWSKLEEHFDTVHSSRVDNNQGQTWEVRALRPKAQ
jgi:2-polyprenyl-3-methyl-5-hydroxy-6-metoxy-1,4-benzoquinol methylase